MLLGPRGTRTHTAEHSVQELTKALTQARGKLAEARGQQPATEGILAVMSRAISDLRARRTTDAATDTWGYLWARYSRPAIHVADLQAEVDEYLRAAMLPANSVSARYWLTR